MNITTRAWILWAKPVREYDSLVCAYSQQVGKIKAIAQGTRKMNSKLRSLLIPFSNVEISLVRKENRELARVIGGKLCVSYPELYNDFEKTTAAHWVSEIMDRLTPLEQVAHNKYDLVGKTFEFIAHVGNTRALQIIFGLRLIDLTGHRLILNHCSDCEAPPLEAQTIWLSQTGLICPMCRLRTHGIYSLDKHSFQALCKYQESPWSLAEYSPNSVELHALEGFVQFLIRHYTAQPIRSDTFRKKTEVHELAQ
ncbi:MAG: DNA repair protein RecO [Elusimicrobia bacterium]|nr:DNA repair protein RecO [Elusimicrobiota bacterium]MBD3412712.1 DNA repair protein RecO [Elusimicrobiota bacterium]